MSKDKGTKVWVGVAGPDRMPMLWSVASTEDRCVARLHDQFPLPLPPGISAERYLLVPDPVKPKRTKRRPA